MKTKKSHIKKKFYCTTLQHANTEEHSGAIKASVTTPDWFLLAMGKLVSITELRIPWRGGNLSLEYSPRA